jgi:Transposase DDE domain group 1
LRTVLLKNEPRFVSKRQLYTGLGLRRRLEIMATDCAEQLTFWDVGRQEVTVDFEGGRVVTDAGLLPVRLLDKELGVLAKIAQRLPDPRAQAFVSHSREALLTQEVYQILAGYPDGNDAQVLRQDPLFQTLVGVSPDGEQPLASGSTLNRFHHAYTRRQAELPWQERPVLQEVDAALTQRLKILNDYLPELFIGTRQAPPAYVVLDIDPSDDPTHGQQVLSLFHGYYDQYQYFPLFVFDGATGFPLAAWLRPGTVAASCGAVSTLHSIVAALRAAWPDVLILVRGDSGLATPEMYEFCEAEGLLYAFGYSSNAVLKARTATVASDLETYYHWYGHREPELQHFEVIEDYRADTWSRPRRIVAKIEINRNGTNRRFVVTNMSGHGQGIYHGFYVQRGDTPERPIGELKNGLHMDRLSFHRFRANGLKLLEHTLAYALVVLHREATAAVPEVANAEVGTLRQRLWKVGALVKTSARRIWFHFSETWPERALFARVYQAVRQFVAGLKARVAPVPIAGLVTLL